MRVICPSCKKTAVIRSNNQLADLIYDLYVACDLCQRSDVWRLHHLHHISQGRDSVDLIYSKIIQEFSPSEIKILQNNLNKIPRH